MISTLFLPAFAASVIQLVTAAVLLIWGRRVAAQKTAAWWRWAAWLPVGGFILGMLGTSLLVLGLIGAFTNVSSAPADQKAQLLSEGIAQAMMMMPLLVAPGFALTIASVVLFAVGSRRAHP